jgi:Spy/CpxP family protein refolding chaperone
MSKIARLALIASLGFNVMFAVGYFCTPTSGQAPDNSEQAADLVAQHLGLDSRQRDTFVSLRTEARQQSEELAQAASLIEAQLCSESASPTADPQAVGDLQKDLADVREAHQQLQFDQFRRFMDVLTPKQRDAALKALHSKPTDRKLRKSGILQEFDSDGDGKLSPAERAKAIQALSERQKSRRDDKLKHRTGEQPTQGSASPGDASRTRHPGQDKSTRNKTD